MKKIFAVIAVIPLTVSLFVGSANAQGTGVVAKDDVAKNASELSTQLIEIEDSNLTGVAKADEALDTIVQAPEEVQLDYFEEVKEDVEDYFTNHDITVDKTEVVELDNAVSIEFNGSDNLDMESEQDSDDAIETAAVPGYGFDLSDGWAGTKDYGSRKFTSTVSVKSAGVTIGKMVLAMHYSIGDYGLKMRYSSIAGTKSLEPIMKINSSSSKVTDGKAEKVEYDMDATGSYNWFLGVKGVGVTFNSAINGKIQLIVLSKSKEYAYVRQTYKFIE